MDGWFEAIKATRRIIFGVKSGEEEKQGTTPARARFGPPFVDDSLDRGPLGLKS